MALGEDEREKNCNGAPTCVPGYNTQQRAHSKNGTRLNEHDDSGLVQSTYSSHPQCGVRVFLACTMSRITIMRMRRLSESEIEWYGIADGTWPIVPTRSRGTGCPLLHQQR